ncbi:MAG: dTMP kinase [Desulfarculus sp.]|nr:dTMP kinase [Desulfarculus sp.]
MAPRRGLFITLEGGEGVGKSTQQGLLLKRLRQEGVKALGSREPGATALGVELRAVLMDLGGEAPCQEAELLLYLADRAQHVRQVLLPALEGGAVVVCDRFADSSEVYQGRVRGMGWRRVRELNRWVCGDLWPDLTLVLDLDPDLGLRRVHQRQGDLGLSPDRLESEGLAFHLAVRQGFLEQAVAEPARIKVVPAARPPERVAQEVWGLVAPLVRAWQQARG